MTETFVVTLVGEEAGRMHSLSIRVVCQRVDGNTGLPRHVPI